MKNTKRILSFNFFALLGAVLMLALGFAPIIGTVLGFVSFLPMGFPQGILGNSAIGEGENEKEIKFMEKLNDKISNTVKEYNRGFISEEHLKTRLEPVEKALNELKESGTNTEEIQKLSMAFEILQGDVQKLSEAGSVVSVSNEDNFKESLADVAKQLQNGERKMLKVVSKTVGTMSNTDSVDGQIPQADRESGITPVNRQTFVIRDASNVSNTNSSLVEWVEQQNIEGGADMTAEGAKKSQLDWEYKVNDAKVRKITSFIKITTEMLNDVEGMMNEINTELTYQVNLKEEEQLITGDGTGQNLNGIEKYAQALDLAALSGTVANPNRMDVLGAAITQIRTNGKGALVANRIFLNPVDIFLMIHATKATTAEYVNPITVVPNVNGQGLPSQIYIWGVPVVASDSIVAGEFLVADMTKFTIRDYVQFAIEMGYENDDFTKNLVTIRGEKRLVSYAKVNHTEAFVTDTFADGIAFLEEAS